MASEIVLVSYVPGTIVSAGWLPPANLSESDWCRFGAELAHAERRISWCIGDWWRAYKPAWGDRGKLALSDEWKDAGLPDYTICRNTSAVCDAFDIARRRANLTFAHHTEVAALPTAEADALLDWAEETIGQMGKPRSTRELRSEVARHRNAIGTVPPGETCTIADLHKLVADGAKFGCIYADPPWLYDNQGTRAATRNHYDGLTVDELCELPVKQLAADDAHLHLWTTNAFLFDAPRIFAAWGFEFRSSLVWIKPQMGIGNYWRNSHELLLSAIRGNAKRFNDHSIMSWLKCDRGVHSAKPEQVRSFIERASPGPYLEMFARRDVHGWTVWGDDVKQCLFAPRDAA